MPLRHFKTPPLDAVVQEVVLNSPLLRRKQALEPTETKNQRQQQQQQRKKGLRKVISGMVTSFRNVITGIIPSTHTTSPDSIPLVDYVSARGKKIKGFCRLAEYPWAGED